MDTSATNCRHTPARVRLRAQVPCLYGTALQWWPALSRLCGARCRQTCCGATAAAVHSFETTGSGTSTTWAAMPTTALSLSFTVAGTQDYVLLFADVSRVQHSTEDVNTMLRIVVDGSTTVALTNTGNSRRWAYDALSFHGVATGLSAGSHTAELQYRTQSGMGLLPDHRALGGVNGGYMRLTAYVPWRGARNFGSHGPHPVFRLLRTV